MSVMLHPCMLCVALLMCLFVLFVACLVKQFAMCFGIVAVLLLNVMDIFSVGGGALLDRPCMVFHRMCCACDPSVHLNFPSICFVCLFVCRKLSPHLRELDHRFLVSLCCFFG